MLPNIWQEKQSEGHVVHPPLEQKSLQTNEGSSKADNTNTEKADNPNSTAHKHWTGQIKYAGRQNLAHWSTVYNLYIKILKFMPAAAAAAAAKLLQSCPTLCDPIDGSPPVPSVPGILQARTLEWVAISFSNAWKWKVKAKSLSRVRLLATPWTAAHQALPSMGFARLEYWSGVPLPSPILGVMFSKKLLWHL